MHRMLFPTCCISGGLSGGEVAWLQVEVLWIGWVLRAWTKTARGLDLAIDMPLRHCGGSPSQQAQADDDDLGIRDHKEAKGERGQGASTPHSQKGTALEIEMSIGAVT